jgi:putative F0F1-ATPase subunit (Ca2+/Mg2+ transporter)
MNRDLGPWALLLQLGWTIAISIVGSFLIGVWVYRSLNASPLGAIIFVLIALLGIIGGSLAVYRQVVKAIDMAAEEQPPRKKKYHHYDYDDGRDREGDHDEYNRRTDNRDEDNSKKKEDE